MNEVKRPQLSAQCDKCFVANRTLLEASKNNRGADITISCQKKGIQLLGIPLTPVQILMAVWSQYHQEAKLPRLLDKQLEETGVRSAAQVNQYYYDRWDVTKECPWLNGER